MGFYWVSLRGYLRYILCSVTYAPFIILWHMENAGHRVYLHFEEVRLLHWPRLRVNSP
ncbi:hypothetical protein BDV27DRAFT_95066 [Aspergillus caelatus]|uniref:Uncharacterized protein n=1 Tax=Aspergillus caelatus TaxID=61420 RepID=A0A5N6ZIF5_9EURO|nr:uncharacterized protein BDV27DRAFT_95066 [Aspergillus caelatus]KAE8357168.1 hypothetical protein BDV27DRAFT_95066 [Aspergillus caelatus]